jgi:protease I
MRVAFLMAPEGVEQTELTESWSAVSEAGGECELVSTATGRIQAFDHLDKAGTFAVDLDALVLPGGVANPDLLRTDDAAVAFARGFFDAGKPVAAICHAPWLLVEADVLRGRTLTSWPSLRTDIRNAGATWADEEAVIDTDGPNTLITSRNPGDLPAFRTALIKEFTG